MRPLQRAAIRRSAHHQPNAKASTCSCANSSATAPYSAASAGTTRHAARGTQTELERGHALFNYKLTVPLPFERGIFETEITGDYLVNLGAA
ncbi:hypothetical protein [Pseudomonas fluorescens]|uniref:Uncharacterized protein n=1 Tax=Pseudomonas fluorescens TaxID=294 RepID=A0A0F4SQT3_PSEFL|nr:hypothetical protein [Pseudomonas fluorescens]KJZ34501.1 hypothetical protein VC34_28645 [Pseudomonas fluorescens]